MKLYLQAISIKVLPSGSEKNNCALAPLRELFARKGAKAQGKNTTYL